MVKVKIFPCDGGNVNIGSRGTAPLIRTVGTREGPVVNIASVPFYLQKERHYPMNRKLGGSWSGSYGKGKNCINHKFLMRFE